MSQNRSTAVMARRVEPADSLDFFPTPPWATRALCEWLRARGSFFRTVWEPACGQGDMAKPLGEYFGQVIASDVHDYGFGAVRDFLWPGHDEPVDWVVTNPPFRLAAEFIARAHEVARGGIAMLVRTAFLEGGERHAALFSKTPPSEILQFVERVPMWRGRLVEEGGTATAYCWLVWRYLKRPAPSAEFHWLAPCRKRLERPGDYPAAVRAEAPAAPLFDA